MKIATINMLLSICLGWAVVFFLIFYIPQRIYNNPAPAQLSYNIADGVETAMITQPSQNNLTLDERLLKGDVEHGKKLFSECATCHSSQKGGKNRVGPALWNVVGRDFASHEGFGYSSAMRHAREEGKKWDFETLFAYLQAPQRLIKGTTMSYQGIKGEQDRADLILYLRSLADIPISLTSDIKGQDNKKQNNDGMQ